jgi:2',3'-cyclic-nucleotide 2'-phosphodiesterase (5'-nucleotidase family)/uncharacterized surface protein with fasciclin (FAS1) repeats
LFSDTHAVFYQSFTLVSWSQLDVHAAFGILFASAPTAFGQSSFLQILHCSDTESSFQDPNTLEEKVTPYSALVGGLQQLASAEGIPSIHITAGDLTIPGPFFHASAEVSEFLHPGLADMAFLNSFPNIANGFGNHEFDDGINSLAFMINASAFPWLAVNLDFSNVQLEDGTPPILIGADAGPCADVVGQVVKSCHLQAGNLTVGLISRAPADFFSLIEDPDTTLPGLDFVGGRDPTTNEAVESAVPQVLEQVDLLTAAGASVIVLMDHAQDFTDDPLSAELLRGVDVVVSAGSTGFMAQSEPNGPFNFLREGDAGTADYPTVLTDSEGKTVLVVNTDQLYYYIGHLIVEFNEAGEVIGWDTNRSGPIATTDAAVALLATALGVDALEPAAEVRDTLDLLQATPSIVAAFEVVGEAVLPLNGDRADVRSRETNLGRVVADSTIWGAQAYADANSLPSIDIALKNGGGIRDSISGPSITRLTIEASLAFDNTLAIVELSAAQLIAALENGISRLPETDGRFPQVAGMMIEYDVAEEGAPALEKMDTPSRVRSLIVSRANGTDDEVIADFMAIGDLNRTFIMATNSFSFTGGDDYLSLAAGTFLGETDLGEQAILENYITDVLGGTVDVVDPPPSPRIAAGGCLTMAQLAIQSPDFSILLATIQAAGLSDALEIEGPVTLFAPSNAALESLPKGYLDGMLQDSESLPMILSYHVIFGAVYTADFVDGQTFTALNGRPLTISVSGDTIMINDATITTPNIVACNGVAHGIDKLLIPLTDADAPTDAPVSTPTPVAEGTPAPAPTSGIARNSPPMIYTFIAVIVASCVWVF